MGKKITVDLDQLNRIVERKVRQKMAAQENLNEAKNTSAPKKKVTKVIMKESELVNKIEKIIKEFDKQKRLKRRLK